MAIIYDIETSTSGRINTLTDKLKLFGYLDTTTNKITILTYRQKKKIQAVLSSGESLVGFYNKGYDNRVLRNNGYTVSNTIDLWHTVNSKKHELGFKQGEKKTLKNTGLKLKLEVVKGDIDYTWLDDNKLIKKHKVEIYKYLETDLILTKEIYLHFKDFIEEREEFKKKLTSCL